eukprot:6195281-Pleurochrysis_carterae.AAC.3
MMTRTPDVVWLSFEQLRLTVLRASCSTFSLHHASISKDFCAVCVAHALGLLRASLVLACTGHPADSHPHARVVAAALVAAACYLRRRKCAPAHRVRVHKAKRRLKADTLAYTELHTRREARGALRSRLPAG